MTPNDRALLTRLADGTGVLLDLDTKFYFTLNETGVFVWDTLADADNRSIDALVGALLDAFEVDEATARADIESVLDALETHRLLTR
jgi:hypothetical protein